MCIMPGVLIFVNVKEKMNTSHFTDERDISQSINSRETSHSTTEGLLLKGFNQISMKV